MTTPTPQQVLSDDEIASQLEASGVSFLRFKGGISGTKEVFTTSGSQDVAKIANGVRAILAKLQAAPQPSEDYKQGWQDGASEAAELIQPVGTDAASVRRDLLSIAMLDALTDRQRITLGAAISMIGSQAAPQAQPEQAAQGVGEPVRPECCDDGRDQAGRISEQCCGNGACEYKRLLAIAANLAPSPAAAVRLSQAASDVLAERQRQISAEGWTPEHDDEHESGELAAAGSAYALAAADSLHPQSQGDGNFKEEPPAMWCWAQEWWKPSDPRRNLIKAASLILAEIERLDRAALATQQAQTAQQAGG